MPHLGPKGMSEEITELSRRISAAFDRMDQGLELLSRKNVAAAAPSAAALGTAPETEGSAALLRALEAARASVEDWAERYRALQARMGDETLAMASEITRLTAELAAARAAAPAATPNADVDELTARIAEQEAELETLRAERALDTAELAAIIAALDPLVQEAPHV